MNRKDALFRSMATAGGHIPRIGPLGESFRAGFYGLYGVQRGEKWSAQRQAWQAGRKRARVEPLALALALAEKETRR